MNREPGAADVDGILTLPGAAAFLGELRECNRRRILLDAASEIVDARAFWHVGGCFKRPTSRVDPERKRPGHLLPDIVGDRQ